MSSSPGTAWSCSRTSTLAPEGGTAVITSPYVYQVELFASDGASLGKAPLAIDWEPAREWTRFSSARAGRIPLNAVERAATARPLWNAGAGEPFVDGFEVALAIG